MNDIKWSYENQDLVVVEDTDNMIQAILNRLNTNTDELDYLYNNYGCDLRQFLGLPTNETTLGLVKNVITDTLNQDERIELMDLDLSYKDTNTLNILLSCTFNDNTLELDLVLNETNGVEING
jgi:phage baseplate assembly protein W